MGSGNKASLGASFFITTFQEYIRGAIPKYKTVDGAIERFNRRTLATILLILGVISTEDGIRGGTIQCTGFEIFSKKRFVKDYCWTQGLFTNRYAYNLPVDSLPAPGITPCIRTIDNFLCSEEETKSQIVYHLWYQWVTLYFFLSAALYMAPYMISKLTILGKLSRFVDILEDPEQLLGAGGSPEKVGTMLATWIKFNLTPEFGEPRWSGYTVPFIILGSKITYLCVSVVHFWMTARMFPIGNFYKLGITWHLPSHDNYTHIGDVLFPKMAGCLIKKYGVTGIVQESGMCNLAPNVVYQYLFLVTWWLVAITIVLNFFNIFGFLGELYFSKIYYKKIEIAYDRRTYTQSVDESKERLYYGLRKEEMKLLFAYYNLGSKILINKIADNIHPAILTFGVRNVAERITKLRAENPELDSHLKKVLAAKSKM